MEIKVEVKAKAARDKVIVQDKKLIVQTKSIAKNNLANQAVTSLLARHLGVSSDKIKIIKGQKTKTKKIEVE